MRELDVFEFLETVVDLIKQDNVLRPSHEAKVVEFVEPAELKEHINISLEETCSTLSELKSLFEKVIKYSIKTNSPNFHNQLYGGTDLFGLGATWLSEALNTNQHTFEVAPVFSLIEQEIIRQLIPLIGYETGDGIFSPGGSLSNMYGMVLARFKKFPEIKTKGCHGLPKLVAFTSEDSHYSLQKAVHWLGLGTDNLVKIKTDDRGRMDVKDLSEKIVKAEELGGVPFLVNATAGTTVLGAIDPISEIAEICHKYNLWLHVDACYGGTLLLSSRYRERLLGSARSDSIAWNPHKMLGAPLQCSIFITRHNRILHECNSASAGYLFQQDKFYDVSYDTGDKSIQCGRKVDAFKLWAMWKARGLAGFENLVNRALDLANYFEYKVELKEGFRLVQYNIETTTICFWYIPEKLRDQTEDELWWQKLNTIAPTIKEQMVKSGQLMIGYTPLETKGYCNFFRMVTTCHPVLTFRDMDFVLEKIEEYGSSL